MHTIEDWRFLVVGLAVLVLQDLSLIEELVVEAKSALVFGVRREIGGSHSEALPDDVWKYSGFRQGGGLKLQRLLPEQGQKARKVC